MTKFIQYNPLDSEIFANPYPCYEGILNNEPVHWNEMFKLWMIMGYDDIITFYKDKRLSSQRVPLIMKRIPEEIRGKMNPLSSSLSLWMLFLDAPAHTRIRSLISKVFTPKYIDTLKSDIKIITEELVDSFVEKGQFDIIGDFAYPLPVIVIARLLGIPEEDRDLLKVWSDGIAAILGAPSFTSQIAINANKYISEQNEYFRKIVKERRKNPQDDLISLLIHAEEQNEILGEEEILATCSLLLFGGHETTTNLIGNGMLALLNHDSEMQKLRNDPTLIAPAVEEMLRFDSPVQWNNRIAKENIEFAGHHIKKGQAVMLVIGSGNRDSQKFSNPQKFDITRKKHKHLAFGYSSHFCIGAALARLEGKYAVNTLLQKIENIELDCSELQWRKDLGFRGLVNFPVKIN
ncbi:cytochrome P450 [Candidatus Uabimicrobium sp. HlEnr_7]|uniref:cytochrome P450 n=1 Tax=Candidatus Uabimicrobium helgolandensis TaxID=3095367 RepID=UPI0035592E42